MKRIKILSVIAGGILLAAILLLVFGNKNKLPKEEENWLAVKPVPFSGYICGYKDTETLIQLPVFLPETDAITLNKAAVIRLCGKDQALTCSDFRLSDFTAYEDTGYKYAILSLKVNLTEEGNGVYDYLTVGLHDGTEVNWGLGEITIIASGQKGEEELEMREFMGKAAQADRLVVSYFNQTDDTITITDFSYPEQIYDKISIQKYHDFELTEPEEGAVIPPGEEKTFLVEMEMNESYAERDDFYFYLLPSVVYEVDGMEKKMPALIQAAIFEPPFTEEFMRCLMEMEEAGSLIGSKSNSEPFSSLPSEKNEFSSFDITSYTEGIEDAENAEEPEYHIEEMELFDETYLEDTVRPVMNGTVTRQEPLTKAEEACLNYKVAEIKSGEHIDLDGDGTRENVTLHRDPTQKEETADWILTVGNSTEIIPYYYDLTGKIYVAAIEKKRGDMQLIQLLLPGRKSLVMDEEAEVYWYAFGKLEHLRRIPCGENGIESVKVSGNGDLITSDLNSRYVRSYRTVRFRITLLRAAEFSIPRLAELPLEPVAYSDWAVLKHTLIAYKDRAKNEKVEIKEGTVLSLLYDDGENWLYADADGEGIWIEVEYPGTVISGEDHYYMTEIFEGLPDAG